MDSPYPGLLDAADSRGAFLAIDDPRTQVHEDALRVCDSNDGMIVELATIDLTQMLTRGELHRRMEAFAQKPWKRNELRQHRVFSSREQRSWGFQENEDRPVSILQAILDDGGNVVDVGHLQDTIRASLVRMTARSMQNGVALPEPMREAAMLAQKTQSHGGTLAELESPGAIVQLLLRVMSKAAAQYAASNGIPVLHTNLEEGKRLPSFSREFTENHRIGTAPHGFVQMNAPLRRGTDMANAANIATESSPVFPAKHLDTLADLLRVNTAGRTPEEDGVDD